MAPGSYCSEELLAGADEAGRGSLVGDMMVAVFVVPASSLGLLADMGVRDSKALAPGARERLYKMLARVGRFAVASVPPSLIDSRSLPLLTEDAIRKALYFVKLSGVSLDCIKRFTVDRYGKPRRLAHLLASIGYRGPIVVEEKADEKRLEVAAASIIAKHVRDTRLKVLRALYGVRGSGYPSDEETVRWVKEVAARDRSHPAIRYSWGTLGGSKKPSSVEGKKSLEDFM
ncbi:MAG: ribonuclease HII [Desulfurococcales archaeon]|nr:ribonuclease HII [Desulfurococcales archaeon]